MTWLSEEPARGDYPSLDFLALSGVERMRAAVRGMMPRPPIHHLFGLTPLSSSVTSSSFTIPATPWLQSAAGVFLAGTSALVADAPLSSAIIATLGPGEVAVTSDLTLNYLRPSSVHSERLNARARPIEVGRRLGLAEAVIEDARGEVLAHSTTRCFIRNFPHPDDVELVPIERPRYDTPDPHERELTTSALAPEVWQDKSFLEICEAMDREELPSPPFAEFFGFTRLEVIKGRFTSTTPSSPWFTSPAGTIYGGLLAYFADSVLTGAMSTMLPAGHICAPLDLKVSFLRPVMPDGRSLTANAKVVHRGKTLVLAECEIVNADNKVAVRASSSATIIEGTSWLPSVIDETPVQ